jgi:hypothetical protein
MVSLSFLWRILALLRRATFGLGSNEVASFLKDGDKPLEFHAHGQSPNRSLRRSHAIPNAIAGSTGIR